MYGLTLNCSRLGEDMDVVVISKLSDSQVAQLVLLYRNEFWCDKRQRADVERMLAHSDIVIGVENHAQELIGFARVLTDHIYKAIIFDVIVHPDWRGREIGKLLMDTVMCHPDLKSIEHFDLNCLPEMYPFYERWGFTADVGKLSFMRRFNQQS